MRDCRIIDFDDGVDLRADSACLLRLCGRMAARRFFCGGGGLALRGSVCALGACAAAGLGDGVVGVYAADRRCRLAANAPSAFASAFAGAVGAVGFDAPVFFRRQAASVGVGLGAYFALGAGERVCGIGDAAVDGFAPGRKRPPPSGRHIRAADFDDGGKLFSRPAPVVLAVVAGAVERNRRHAGGRRRSGAQDNFCGAGVAGVWRSFGGAALSRLARSGGAMVAGGGIAVFYLELFRHPLCFASAAGTSQLILSAKHRRDNVGGGVV